MLVMSPEWQRVIVLFIAAQHAQGIAKTSRIARRQHLEHLARRVEVSPWSVTIDDLTLYIAAQEWAQETLRGRVTTMRLFYEWATKRGHVSESPAELLGTIKPAAPSPRPVPDDVYLAALARADPVEALWIDLAAEHGLRRTEISLISGRDIVPTLLGHDLIVHGKGRKIRNVPLTTAMARALRTLAAEHGNGWLFPGAHDGRVSPRWLGERVTRLLGGGWTTHKLRHRAATRFWVAGGGDPYVVADLMGWASLEMVRVYVQLPDERKRRIVEAASRSGQTLAA